MDSPPFFLLLSLSVCLPPVVSHTFHFLALSPFLLISLSQYLNPCLPFSRSLPLSLSFFLFVSTSQSLPFSFIFSSSLSLSRVLSLFPAQIPIAWNNSSRQIRCKKHRCAVYPMSSRTRRQNTLTILLRSNAPVASCQRPQP